MTGVVESSRWSVRRAPGGWTLLDVGLAAVCLVVVAEEIVASPDMTPRGPLLAAAILTIAPLAFRTSLPAATTVASAVGFLLMNAAATGPLPPQLAILPVLVALYTGASRTRGRPAAITGAVTLGLMVAATTITEEGDLGDFWPWLLWGGAWAAGTFVRRRGDVAAHHAGRAALLEVEARTTAMVSAQRERDRIARELHDVVAHSVSVMVVQAGAERLRLGADAGRTGTALEAIEDSGRLALAELRTMLGVLRDRSAEELAPLSGLPEIPALVERVRATGLPVEVSCHPADLCEAGAEPDASGAAGLAAYRIVQESLTNVVRHAGPVPTRVELTRTDRGLAVTVLNDAGSLPAGVEGAGGRGLAGMRERATALGGDFDAGPQPDGGFRVRATLPTAAGA